MEEAQPEEHVNQTHGCGKGDCGIEVSQVRMESVNGMLMGGGEVFLDFRLILGVYCWAPPRKPC